MNFDTCQVLVDSDLFLKSSAVFVVCGVGGTSVIFTSKTRDF